MQQYDGLLPGMAAGERTTLRQARHYWTLAAEQGEESAQRVLEQLVREFGPMD